MKNFYFCRICGRDLMGDEEDVCDSCKNSGLYDPKKKNHKEKFEDVFGNAPPCRVHKVEE